MKYWFLIVFIFITHLLFSQKTKAKNVFFVGVSNTSFYGGIWQNYLAGAGIEIGFKNKQENIFALNTFITTFTKNLLLPAHLIFDFTYALPHIKKPISLHSIYGVAYSNSTFFYKTIPYPVTAYPAVSKSNLLAANFGIKISNNKFKKWIFGVDVFGSVGAIFGEARPVNNVSEGTQPYMSINLRLSAKMKFNL